jgi:hypothetical protein
MLLVVLGLIVGLACLAGRSDERLLERHVRQQERLRRVTRLRALDREAYRHRLRAALTAGIVVGTGAAVVGALILV